MALPYHENHALESVVMELYLGDAIARPPVRTFTHLISESGNIIIVVAYIMILFFVKVIYSVHILRALGHFTPASCRAGAASSLCRTRSLTMVSSRESSGRCSALAREEVITALSSSSWIFE